MKKRFFLIIGIVLCLFLSATFLFLGLKPLLIKPKTADFAPERPVAIDDNTDSTANAGNMVADKKCPVDFASLKSINSDIYAWIDIPGTNISYPVLQSENDDAFYLNHDSDGNYSSNGAIFSEKEYNTKSFEDPVTVLYGHDMLSGDMFGKLQSYYSNGDFLRENDEILIYTPHKELRYKIFAATPYNSFHLLYYYPFEKSYVFNQFFDELYNYRTVSSTYIKDRKPFHGDKVLVLSTCMNSGNQKRYLVMGVLSSTVEYN
ncbi:MAG: class B sortase [Oscillospiraceae bacterium]|nr:class B sortase [Oscillospiraceae bacterium]